MTRVIVVRKSSFNRSFARQLDHIEDRLWDGERPRPVDMFAMFIGRFPKKGW
jgi:hypothetical protein